MAVDLLGKRQVEAHEHRGPDDGVEADNLFSDKVHVRRPELREVVILVIFKAERRHIVKERIDPHIDHVTRVKVHGNAPGKARTGHAEVLQAGVNEIVDHLVHAGLWLEEVGLGQKLADTAGVFGEAEEIGLLLRVMHLAAAVGTFAVFELALGPERLARRAVFSFIRALVDIAVFIHLAEDLLNRRDMIVVRRADEAVVRDIHQLPQIENALFARDDVVDKLLRGHARGLGLLFDLLAVLVRSGQEHHVAALEPLVARHRVGGHGAVGVADVELGRGVVDRRCDIKFFLTGIAHGNFLLSAPAPNESAANIDRG